MNIGVIKPDFKVHGGFERVVQKIESILESKGHAVTRIDVTRRDDRARVAFGVPIPPNIWRQAPFFFTYLGLANDCANVEVNKFDVIISTQPPSFAVNHPRHISLFYHHNRIFYDLSEVTMESGYVDREVHTLCTSYVRAVDRHWLENVTWFLAGSHTVKDRLKIFNGLSDNVSVLQAGVGVDLSTRPDSHPASPKDVALCITRMEFHKRPELFVQAMKYRPAVSGVLVGSGSRLPWVRQLDQLLSNTKELDSFSDKDLWVNTGTTVGTRHLNGAHSTSNVNIEGFIEDDALRNVYGSAFCVVAPALLEDYGLTVIEAMSRAKPVIVCSDGGGLTELVNDGVDGIVVEPSGRAISEAIGYLRDNPKRATEMGEAGLEKAKRFTWANAEQVVLETVTRLARS